jgi:hypothetical protein
VEAVDGVVRDNKEGQQGELDLKGVERRVKQAGITIRLQL